jgi:hypothetical protein
MPVVTVRLFALPVLRTLYNLKQHRLFGSLARENFSFKADESCGHPALVTDSAIAAHKYLPNKGV